MRWDEMSMSQKSEAIGLMVRNGVTDIGTMKQMWDDMDGRKKQKPSYAEWVKGVNLHFMGPDYNLKAAYEELPFETMEAWKRDPNANHLPDTYKLPNHPTFSDESKYSQGPVIGGSWHYKPISQGQYLPEEILVGGINGIEPNPAYRSFAEGGRPDDPPVLKQSEAPFRHLDKKKEERLKRLYSISANIMNFGKVFSGEDSMGWEDPFDGEWTGLTKNEYSTPYRIANNGVAQATFLMPRKQQAEIFKRAGYTEHPNDYGLVKKAVVKDGRDIPVWQSTPDSAKRDDLIYLGYTLDEDSEAQKYLEDPGVMPTAYYVDSKTGNAFFKGWDLNDYDVSNGNHRQYNFIQRLGANVINRLGSPVVVTTGFQPTEVYYLPSEIKEEMYNQHHLIPTLELIAPEDFSSYDEYKSVKNKLPKWSLPEVRIGLE